MFTKYYSNFRSIVSKRPQQVDVDEERTPIFAKMCSAMKGNGLNFEASEARFLFYPVFRNDLGVFLLMADLNDHLR